VKWSFSLVGWQAEEKIYRQAGSVAIVKSRWWQVVGVLQPKQAERKCSTQRKYSRPQAVGVSGAGRNRVERGGLRCSAGSST